MKIILIRHPETEWNVKKKIQGSREGKVTKHGLSKAQKLVSNLEYEQIAKVIHADNLRTKILGELIADRYESEIIMDERLNERDFGELESKFKADINDPSYDPYNFAQRAIWRPEKGETLLEVAFRANSLIEELKSVTIRSHPIVLVTSGLTIKTILLLQNNLSISDALSLSIEPLDLFELNFAD